MLEPDENASTVFKFRLNVWFRSKRGGTFAAIYVRLYGWALE